MLSDLKSAILVVMMVHAAGCSEKEVPSSGAGFVGGVDGLDAMVALATNDGRAMVYVCNGERGVAERFWGAVASPEDFELTNSAGARVSARRDEGAYVGSFTFDDVEYPFSTARITGDGGYYAVVGEKAIAARVAAGWVVDDSGAQRGSFRRSGKFEIAPTLSTRGDDGASEPSLSTSEVEEEQDRELEVEQIISADGTESREGVCDGAVDECGVCGGPGIAEGSCDCDGAVLDACGICGGSGPPPDGCNDLVAATQLVRTAVEGLSASRLHGVVLAGASGTLFQLDLQTLADVADVSLGSELAGRPAFSPSDIDAPDAFVATEFGAVFGIAVGSNEPTWQVNRSGLCARVYDAGPAVHPLTNASAEFAARYDEDLVFLATAKAGCSGETTNNQLDAFGDQNGAHIWGFTSDNLRTDADLVEALDQASSAPIVDVELDRIYLATEQRDPAAASLFAISTVTGQLLWGANAGAVRGAPVLLGDRLYLATVAGRIKAFDRITGVEVWRIDADATPIIEDVSAAVVNAETMIAATNFLGDVWLVRDLGATAETVFSAPLKDSDLEAVAAATQPLLHAASATIFVGAVDGRVYQLAISDGALDSRALEPGFAVTDVHFVREASPLPEFGENGTPRFLIAGGANGSVAKYSIPWVQR